ncbi:hypothetical protein D3C73_486910 [compost metagenome]
MGMNAERGARQLKSYAGYNLLNFIREGSAVRIAHDQPIRTGFTGRSQDGCCIFGIVLITVEKVLCIENDLKAFALQIGNGLADHGKILFKGSLQCGVNMEVP